jgi:hypothetical protein
MEINKLNVYSKTNFKGHEAKPLEAIVVQNSRYGHEEIFKQLDAIASQYKVKVFKAPPRTSPWTQDVLIPTHNKKVTGYIRGFEEKEELGLIMEYMTGLKKYKKFYNQFDFVEWFNSLSMLNKK